MRVAKSRIGLSGAVNTGQQVKHRTYSATPTWPAIVMGAAVHTLHGVSFGVSRCLDRDWLLIRTALQPCALQPCALTWDLLPRDLCDRSPKGIKPGILPDAGHGEVLPISPRARAAREEPRQVARDGM